jgi:hypothetical protein
MDLTIAPATASDAAELYEIEVACWGTLSAMEESILRRIAVFPGGTLMVIDQDRRIWAFVATMPVDEVVAASEIAAWHEITGGDDPARALSLSGKVLYGINLSKRRGVRGHVAARIAVQGAMGLAVHLRRKALWFGSRLPSFCKWDRCLMAADYVRVRRFGPFLFYCDDAGGWHRQPRAAVAAARSLCSPADWPLWSSDGWTLTRTRPLDEQLAFYETCRFGGSCPRPRRLLPDFFEDPASGNYGAQMVWENPYVLTAASPVGDVTIASAGS